MLGAPLLLPHPVLAISQLSLLPRPSLRPGRYRKHHFALDGGGGLRRGVSPPRCICAGGSPFPLLEGGKGAESSPTAKSRLKRRREDRNKEEGRDSNASRQSNDRLRRQGFRSFLLSLLQLLCPALPTAEEEKRGEEPPSGIAPDGGLRDREGK